jgi:hypothetical protein
MAQESHPLSQALWVKDSSLPKDVQCYYPHELSSDLLVPSKIEAML